MCLFTDEEEDIPTSSGVKKVDAVADPELFKAKLKKKKDQKSSESVEMRNCEERQVKYSVVLTGVKTMQCVQV